MKLLLNIIGSLALLLAVLGLFLPLLPTTPFLLLASVCYAKGSVRMQKWLHENRLFGEYIRNYEQGRGIPLRAKVVAITMLWVSLAFSAYHVESLALKLMLAFIGAGVTIYLVRLKTLRTDDDTAAMK